MEKMKLISVRVDEDTLMNIDAIAESSFYWRRSDIIRGLLAAIVNNCDRYDARSIALKGLGYDNLHDLVIKLEPKEKASRM